MAVSDLSSKETVSGLESLFAFAVGVWVLQQSSVLPSPWLAAALPPLAAVAAFARGGWRRLGVAVLALAVGYGYAATRAALALGDALAYADQGRDTPIVATIAEVTVQGPDRTLFVADVRQADAGIPRRIRLAWYAPPKPDLFPCATWNFTVRLKRPHGSANAAGFDLEARLLAEGIRAVGYVAEGHFSRWNYDPFCLIDGARLRVAQRFARVLGEGPATGVLIALANGEQGRIDRHLWQLFNATGVSHLMSISGLHVTMLAGLVAGVVYFGWRRFPALVVRWPARRAAALAGVAAAALYALFTGFAIPAQRTFYMVAVVAAALWAGRFVHPARILLLALAVVLAIDPWAVLSAGFWLSFSAVAAMFLVLAGRRGRPGFLRGWLLGQGAVTLALFPLTLLLFQRVSLVGPVANAIAIPLVSLAVVPMVLAAGFLGLDWLLPPAALLVGWLIGFLEWLNQLPMIALPAPTAIGFVLAVLGVFWLLLPGVPARWLGLVLLLPVVYPSRETLPRGSFELSVLDVGQGQAVLIRTAEHSLLMDAGPAFRGGGDAGESVVLPVLWAEGIYHLNALILSHRDGDHAGGGGAIRAGMKVGRYFASGIPGADPCSAGPSWVWDRVSFHLTALSDQGDNASSCVLRVSSAQGSALVAGDVEGQGEAALLAAGFPLVSDLLVAPHHGGKRSSSPAWVAAVRPRVVVFSVGYGNRFLHPRPEVVARYREIGAEIFRTDRDGAVTGYFGPKGLHMKAVRRDHHRYWQEPWYSSPTPWQATPTSETG